MVGSPQATAISAKNIFITTVKNKRINVRVEKKVEELDGLHKRHLSRPNLDEDGGEETKIQKLTQEATAVSFLFLNF